MSKKIIYIITKILVESIFHVPKSNSHPKGKKLANFEMYGLTERKYSGPQIIPFHTFINFELVLVGGFIKRVLVFVHRSLFV